MTSRDFIRALGRSEFIRASPLVERHLLTLFADDTIDHQDLARAAASLLVLQPFNENSELLHALLRKTINVSLLLEQQLIAARRALLEALEQRREAALRVIVSLACQAWNNGFIWPSSTDEEARVCALPSSIEAAALRCAYAPMNDPELLTRDERCRDLLRCQCEEPNEERVIARTLDRGAFDDDAITAAVRRQYEEHPYPRWLSIHRPTAVDETTHDMLVAGCGTGREAIVSALKHPAARVTAIDISLRSLAYATRKAKELGAANITFRHADLRQLADHETYAEIFSVGVLHHLSDPLEGLRQLTHHLRSGGTMTLGVYSRNARRWLDELRTLGGDARTRDELRHARERIFAAVSPLRLRELEGIDFFELNHFRDTLYHAHEVELTMRELGELIAAAGLRFAGFDDLGDDGRRFAAITDLATWEEIEAANPDLFNSMYVARLVKP